MCCTDVKAAFVACDCFCVRKPLSISIDVDAAELFQLADGVSLNNVQRVCFRQVNGDLLYDAQRVWLQQVKSDRAYDAQRVWLQQVKSERAYDTQQV